MEYDIVEKKTKKISYFFVYPMVWINNKYISLTQIGPFFNKKDANDHIKMSYVEKK